MNTIVAAARSAIGTPFRHQGRVAGKRLDCAGLIVHVAEVIGISHADQQGYSRHPSDGLLESALDSQDGLIRIQISEIVPGDILLMKFSGDPQHLAIYSGYSDVYQADGIIHACAKSRKVCEHVLTDEWRRRIVRAYRFKEVTS